jgi:hypothetical protein
MSESQSRNLILYLESSHCQCLEAEQKHTEKVYQQPKAIERCEMILFGIVEFSPFFVCTTIKPIIRTAKTTKRAMTRPLLQGY